MIDRGTVNSLQEAIIPIRIRGPVGLELEIQAIVDTGYTGSLTLPSADAVALGLVRRSGSRAVLADGTVRRFDTFAAEVFWGGKWTGIVVSAVGDESLLGMSLLSGRVLRIETVPGGAVEVRPLGVA
jgi:clan AA aspartic protease